MPRKNPLTASRLLSSEIMKSPSWRGAVVSIVKEGQRKGYSRDWMILMISALVVERMAARIEARHNDPKWRKLREQITGRSPDARLPPRTEKVTRAKRKVGGGASVETEVVENKYYFTVSDMKAASARLLRKVPMLEKCENDPPGKFPARFDLFAVKA